MNDHARPMASQQPEGNVGRQVWRFCRGGLLLGLMMVGSTSLIVGCGASTKTETLDVQTHVETPEESKGSDEAQKAAVKDQSSTGQSPY